jgi:outer membrane protein OmpA-like peptidoglycan-associated protein
MEIMTITKNPTKFRSALALVAAAALAACASAPQSNARLDQARAAYEAAARDAQVARSAPVELQQAQQALQQAQSALRAGADVSEVEHYAYLAQRRTEVAQQAGLIAKADQAVAQSQVERDKIVIASRTRDADTALMAAEKARNEADAARKLAEERLAAATLARKQTEEASKRAGSLEAQLAAMKAKATDRGMVLTLGDVLFDTGRAKLKPGAMRTVDQVATFLSKNPARRVLIEGHTDSQGSESFNRDLSQRRADAVRDALGDRRISADRVETHGLGEGYPVASNTTASGRQQNRRVELIFSDDSGAIKARVN